MKRSLLVGAISLLVAVNAFAESSVWQVKKGNSIMYIGGTIHMLRQSDDPFPQEYDKAYKESECIVFESNLGPDPFKGIENMRKYLLQAQYPDGSTIDNHLSPKVYAELKSYCTKNDIKLETIKSYKMAPFVREIRNVKIDKLGITKKGADRYYYDKAKSDDKKTIELETIDEQIHIFTESGEGDGDAFITYSLEDVKNMEKRFDNFADAWKKGDVNRLNDFVVDIQKKTPKYYKMIIVDRNNKWLSKIDDYLKTPQVKFILVGIDHLVGKDGIIESLGKKGYKVEKLQ